MIPTTTVRVTCPAVDTQIETPATALTIHYSDRTLVVPCWACGLEHELLLPHDTLDVLLDAGALAVDLPACPDTCAGIDGAT